MVIGNVISQSVQNQVFFENTTTLSGHGNNENFIVMNFDSLGNITWKDISKSTGTASINSIVSDSNNFLFLVGSFYGEIDFANRLLNSSITSEDVLVISYQKTGYKRWVQLARGTGGGPDIGSHISIDSTNIMHVAGLLSCDLILFENLISPPSPGNSIFVAQMIANPLGLEDTTPLQFGISVYPNPGVGTIYVEVEDEFISEIKIYNTLGQRVQTLSPKTHSNKIEINNLESGYYIIDVLAESGKHVAQKLIVE